MLWYFLEWSTERFHSRGQHLCKSIGTKESFYTTKKFLPQNWFVTATWPSSHYSGTLIWRTCCHEKTLYSNINREKYNETHFFGYKAHSVIRRTQTIQHEKKTKITGYKAQPRFFADQGHSPIAMWTKVKSVAYFDQKGINHTCQHKQHCFLKLQILRESIFNP